MGKSDIFGAKIEFFFMKIWFFEILCYVPYRNWFIWHSPCESRLHSASENVCHTNIRKVCLNYKFCTMCVWSKTTLITSSVGGSGVDPPPRKMNTFFLRSLTLSVPIYRHFQSNGDNWRSIKHQKNFFYIIEHYINFFVKCLLLRQLTPFDWKCL